MNSPNDQDQGIIIIYSNETKTFWVYRFQNWFGGESSGGQKSGGELSGRKKSVSDTAAVCGERQPN